MKRSYRRRSVKRRSKKTRKSKRISKRRSSRRLRTRLFGFGLTDEQKQKRKEEIAFQEQQQKRIKEVCGPKPSIFSGRKAYSKYDECQMREYLTGVTSKILSEKRSRRRR